MRRVIFGLLAILLGLFTAIGWYGFQHGFSKKWRTYLAQQFHKQGFEVSVRRLTLDPFRGLVAREMKVYDPENRKHVIAVIDQVNLGVNYSRVFRGKALLDSVDLRDARLSFPLDPASPRSETAVITHLHARIFFPPRQIYLSHADAEFYGIHLSASGRVIKPRDFRVMLGLANSPGNTIATIIREMKTLRYEGHHPFAQIEFSGDLAQPESFSATLNLHASDVRRRRYLLRRFDLSASFRNGVLELQQLDAADSRGELHARATYGLSSQKLECSIRSSLDLQELNRAFRFVDKPPIFLDDPPRFEFTVQGTLAEEPRLRAVGHLSLGNFSLKSEAFTSLAADVSWDGDRWSVRDFHLTHRSGDVSGDAMQLPENFRAVLHSSIDPKALLPLLSGRAADWLSQFEFGSEPTVDLQIAGTAPSPDTCSASGDVQFAHTTFRNLQASGTAKLEYAEGAVSLAPFPGGEKGNGRVTFDFSKDEVRIDPPPPRPAPETPPALEHHSAADPEPL